MNNNNNKFLFPQEDMDRMESNNLFHPDYLKKPVTCLGMTFDNDDARREYFREELRKKLPELKQIEGFPIGEDDDIINLSDPPYYTACPNPWLNDFIEQWEKEKVVLEKEGKREADFEVTEPYASDVSEGKNESIYNAHSYHTKVPPKAIKKFLNHYTEIGDIVLDGFSGSGMTGVACKSLTTYSYDKLFITNNQNLKVILNDLSPAATNLSYNNIADIDLQSFINAANSILERAKTKYGWMYETMDGITKCKRDVEYYVWSEISICETCGCNLKFSEIAFDDDYKSLKPEIRCPKCNSIVDKRKLKPQVVSYFDKELNIVQETPKRELSLICYKNNRKKEFKRPDNDDIEICNRVNQMGKSSIPIVRIPDMQMMRVGRMKSSKINHIHQFYFEKTKYVLGFMWSEAQKISDSRIQNMIKYWLDSQFVNLSYRNRYRPNVSFPYNPMTGVFYIPMMSSEANPFVAYKNKLTKIVDAFKNTNSGNMNFAINTSSMSMMPLKDNSIDYIFTDPPFGENIYYSDLNFYIEGWNKVITDAKPEAIVDKVKNKTISTYNSLIERCFNEYYRVLKPGKWISIIFSNTSAAIWNGIQNALNNSGFIIANVSALDKQQGTFQAVNTTTAVLQDLVISCYKSKNEYILGFSMKNKDVWTFVDEYLNRLPVTKFLEGALISLVERTPRLLFDRMISFFVQHGFEIPMGSQEFQQGLRERYIERDGMFFTAIQAAEYEEKKKAAPEFVSLGIIVSDEASGIQWLRNQLRDTPKTYQEIQPDWMQAINGLRKNDILPELKQILEENFIEMEDGKWRLPNIQDDVDKEALRTKSLLREFKRYVEAASKPKAKIKEARVEALRAGFKQCYIEKDFKTIVLVGNKIPQNLRDEDEILLQFYDIAVNKI
jgi:N2,N2-dimethylguanosine tRNA methyltransferase